MSVSYLGLDDLPGYLYEQHGITGAIGTPLTRGTVAVYHRGAEKRRRDGAPRPGDFPPPDRKYGRSPVWLPETIDQWVENRPGRGAGGGRPPKQT
ncbi:hypothetical protein AB0I72_19075 [Nocardiopsis sp. NPDC049922]|uniref:hypothetical protein n=1 Tax=Nocardiopsis sp. NPDC049922 TaxID=3155157 RepID=UPI0033E56527